MQAERGNRQIHHRAWPLVDAIQQISVRNANLFRRRYIEICRWYLLYDEPRIQIDAQSQAATE